MPYDLLIVGQPSLDSNTDYLGHTVREIGGAVTYAGTAREATAEIAAKGRKAPCRSGNC